MATTAPDKNSSSGYYPIVAWLVAIGIVLAVVRTKWGYYVTFMFVITSIIIVLAVGAPTLAAIMKAGGGATNVGKPGPLQPPPSLQGLTPDEISILKSEGIIA